MDALEHSDVELDGQTSASLKFIQAVEMMAEGLRLKRALLRQQHPELNEAALEKLFLDWLSSEDDL
ncbi:MAG: hypothetical protein SFV15_22320 [Polyangiaceae bacterium]|nr:hypothetical protein [Polyangiaceae bacterium]